MLSRSKPAILHYGRVWCFCAGWPSARALVEALACTLKVNYQSSRCEALWPYLEFITFIQNDKTMSKM